MSIVTLTFEVTLTGTTRYVDALEVINGVHHLTGRIGATTVTITPGPTGEAGPEQQPPVPDDAPVLIFPYRRSVQLRGVDVHLTRLEFDLLRFLAENPSRVFSREELLQYVWRDDDSGARTVDVHVRRLRAKIGIDLISTVRRVGYRLADGALAKVVRAPEWDTPEGAGRSPRPDQNQNSSEKGPASGTSPARHATIG